MIKQLILATAVALAPMAQADDCKWAAETVDGMYLTKEAKGVVGVYEHYQTMLKVMPDHMAKAAEPLLRSMAVDVAASDNQSAVRAKYFNACKEAQK